MPPLYLQARRDSCESDGRARCRDSCESGTEGNWKATQDPLAPRGTNGEWASTEKQKNELVEDHYWTHRFVSLSRTRQGTTARDSCESDRSALSAATANTRSPSESLRTGTSSASLDRQTVSKRVRRGEEYESNGDLCRTRELTLPLLPLSPPFDRLRPSNVIASLTAATDDADATEQPTV